MFVIYLFCLIIIAILSVWCKNICKYASIRKLPGPTVQAIFENLFNSSGDVTERFHTMVNLNERYGPVVKLWSNPFKPSLIVSDPKYIKVLLSSNKHLDKSATYNLFHNLLKDGLGIVKSDVFRKQRKVINPAFSSKMMEHHIATLERYGNVLVDTIYKQVTQGAIDITPLTRTYNIQLNLDSLMGINLIDRNDVENQRYVNAITDYLNITANHMFSCLRQINFLYRYTTEHERLKECVQILKGLSSDIIKRRIQERANQYDTNKKLLDILLDELDDSELLDNVSLFLFTGSDTPASVLNFALFEITRNPDIQKKVLEETISILGKNKDTIPTLQDLQQMKYLECVIKETIRLYTPIPAFDRRTEEDFTIDQVFVPKGTDICICAYQLHHNEKYFPDPYKFDPARFLPENLVNLEPFAYIPFSAGPRNCPAPQFGILQVKYAITKIVRNFDLVPVKPEHQPILGSRFILKSENGVLINVKIREW